MRWFKNKSIHEFTGYLALLRRKIVFIHIGFASVVVLILSLIGAGQSKQTLEDRYWEQFHAHCEVLQTAILTTQTIDNKEIYQYSVENQLIPYIRDNQKRIKNPYFPAEDVSLLALTHPLLQQARQKIAQQSGSWTKSIVRQDYTVSHDGATWFAQFCALPTTSGEWIELYVFSSSIPFKSEWNRMRLLFVCGALGGILLLAALSFVLTTRAIQPAQLAKEREKEFIAAASHELKSPLAVIQTSAELLPSEDRNIARFRSNILSETRRMSLLVQELLISAKADALPKQTKFSALDTDAFLWDIYETYQDVVRKSGDRLTLQLPTDTLSKVYADEELLKQVMSILLSNAVQHSPQGIGITVAAIQQKKAVKILVSDTGPGISDKENVFQSSKRNGRGKNAGQGLAHLGLGLNLAQKIVSLHHGQIWILDTKGGGTTIAFTIPSE